MRAPTSPDAEIPLKVGLVSFAWSNQHNGGLRSHVQDLATHLHASGVGVHVHSVNTDPKQPMFETCSWIENGIAVQEVNYSYRDARTLLDFQQVPHAELILTTWAAREQLDLIHIHHNLFLGMGAIPALAALAPVITSLHDYWPLDPRGQLFDQTDASQHPLDADAWEAGVAQTWPQLLAASRASAAYFNLATGADGTHPSLQSCWLAYSRRCLAASRYLISPSSACAAVFKAHGIQQPIRVIENGVPTDHLAGGVQHDTGSRPQGSRLRLAILGNIAPSKGQLAFCRACLRLSLRDLLEIHLHGSLPDTYQGDATPQNALRELCTDHPQLFTLAGPYEREQLPEIFSSSDLVVVPSLWEEVYGLVAREALSYGLPLIVSSAGGLADLAERSHVFQLNHHDPEHWGTALEEAFSAGPLLRWIYQRRRGELPADSAVRSSQACSAELAALYREVVAEAR